MSGGFLWSAGGQRMTPDQIEAQQKIAASLTKPDYSPIASPWQGLARVSGNVLGALEDRQAANAQTRNQAESASVLASLTSSGGADGKPDIAALLSGATNPYVDDSTRKILGTAYGNATKAPPTNDTVADFNFWKNTLSPDQFDQWLGNKINPPHFAVLPDGKMGMVGGYQPPTSSGQPGLATVTDQASYDAIPSGQQFTDPSGNVRVKP